MAGHGEGSAIGIDLGTTYSCVGVWQHDRIEIIVNDQDNRTTPSYVAFTDKERLIGDAAMNQVARNPSNSVFDKLETQQLVVDADGNVANGYERGSCENLCERENVEAGNVRPGR